jgi:tRNA(Ser,Leu) C12 N-acetylase TAN1
MASTDGAVSPERPPAAWNLVVTAREGMGRRLRGRLAPLVDVRRSGFRNVLVGYAPDAQTLLDAVADLRAARPGIDACLGKVVPLERTFPVRPETFQADLEREAAPFVDRLVGRSFHVRVERRGHKGVLDSHACEQALGAFLCSALETRGGRPVVEFADPDAVLVVEIIGDTAGLALVTREVRRRFPFVKVD